ncbi:MAG TPA: two-component regulator propeller domain-containing protein, partial [Acidobacteriota bacterium]|nr:two-component regulator propeller domain-containing protein [Acidobacteriota bacterium]
MLWMALARHFGWLWLIGLIGTGLSGIALAQMPVRPAQAGMRFVRNYTTDEYKAADQNWAIVQDPRGVMYFGNGRGILEYDGVTWRLTPLANRSTVRSLAVDAQGHVFAGGINDFGYLTPDDKGQQQFVSLVEKLPEDARHFADVWRTYSTPNDVVFQTVNYVFLWNGQTLDVVQPAPSGGTFSACLQVNQDLYLVQRSLGLFKLVNRALQPVPGGQWMVEKRLSGLLPMSDGKLLAVVRDEGLFVYDGQTFTPFAAPEVSQALVAWDPYKAMVLPDGRFAFATITHGAVILRPDGTLDEIIDKKAGLQNQQVKNILADRDGNLWMGLDNGIARAEVISPFTVFDDRCGIEDVVQAFIEHAGKYYLSTANGAFVWDPQVTQPSGAPLFQYISGPKTSCFDFGIAGNDLFVSADNGVFQLEGTKATKVLDSLGTAVSFSFCTSKRYPNRLYVGQQYGLAVLERRGSSWVSAGKVPGIDTEIRSIIELSDGTLWLGTHAEGILRVEFTSLSAPESFNPATVHVSIRRFTAQDGLPMMSRIRLMRISDRLLFLSQNGMVEFDEARGRFFPSTFLSDPTLPPLRRLVSDSQGTLWGYFEDNTCARLTPVAGRYQVDTITLKRMPGAIYNWVFVDSHNTIWFGGSKGLVRIDPQRIKPPPSPVSVLIRKVLAGNKRDLMFGGATSATMPVLHLPYTSNQVRIEYALPTFIQEQSIRYQYWLEGVDANWSELTTETIKEYTNLHEGQYHIRIRAEDALGYQSLETVYAVQILPPWYRTWWAYAGYIVFLGGIGFGGLKWRVRTLETQKKALERLVVERTKTVTQQKDEISRQNSELDAINHQLADNIEQLRKAHLDTEHKNRELEFKNQELLASQQRADRIFSALAQALPGTILDGKYRLDSQIG